MEVQNARNLSNGSSVYNPLRYQPRARRKVGSLSASKWDNSQAACHSFSSTTLFTGGPSVRDTRLSEMRLSKRLTNKDKFKLIASASSIRPPKSKAAWLASWFEVAGARRFAITPPGARRKSTSL